MVENIGNEMRRFIRDLKENIKDPKELQYLLHRTEALFDVIFREMEAYADQEEKKINKLKEKIDIQDQRMEQIEAGMHYLNKNINHIYNDIYDEDVGDFEITCPYCNYDFDADIDENNKEIICPECNNVIELDWEGESENNSLKNNDNPSDKDERRKCLNNEKNYIYLQISIIFFSEQQFT